jgi:uncharacterized protein with FMN-binding domain
LVFDDWPANRWKIDSLITAAERKETQMGRSIGALSLVCAVLLVVLGGCAFIGKINKLTVEDVTVHQVKDGTYEGSQDFSPVTASVRVTVSAGRITDIVMLSHGHGPNHGADAIFPRVIVAQSLAVDAVSGSTYSSKVVLKAIETALKKGL